jgi:hypothetical protein
MKHSTCGTRIEENIQIRQSNKLFIEFKGIINEQKEVARLGDTKLVSEDTQEAVEYLFYCKHCGGFHPMSEIVFEVRCICGGESEDEQKCDKLDRNICPNCYKVLMPRICQSCQYIIGCKVYQRNNK